MVLLIFIDIIDFFFTGHVFLCISKQSRDSSSKVIRLKMQAKAQYIFQVGCINNRAG